MGSDIDLRRSAKLARATLVVFTAYAGLMFTVAPHLVRTGNVALVRDLMPLQIWGVTWLACAAVLCTRRREAGYSMLALTWALWALATGATAITGTMDAPLAPGLWIMAAAMAWWLRVRSMRRTAGLLLGDDLTAGR